MLTIAAYAWCCIFILSEDINYCSSLQSNNKINHQIPESIEQIWKQFIPTSAPAANINKVSSIHHKLPTKAVLQAVGTHHQFNIHHRLV